jgi:hypothetical protein
MGLIYNGFLHLKRLTKLYPSVENHKGDCQLGLSILNVVSGVPKGLM